MAKKYGDIRYKWLAERGFDVLGDTHQHAYMQSLWAPPKVIYGVFCESPAGTGKTHLAALAGAYAVEKGEYDRIIYIRNPAPVGKELGFLPGDIDGKTMPYMQPFVKALDYVKPGTFEKWSEEGKAFAITPTYERGVTYENAFVIIDEAQSFSLDELHMVYTRPTTNCKVVTTGSLNQIDDSRLKRICGLTPLEVFMRHYDNDLAVHHKLITNYRGAWSNHADKIRETIKRIEMEARL